MMSSTSIPSFSVVLRRWLLTVGLLLALFVSGQAAEGPVVWTPDNLPMVHLQDARRYVCDPDGLLSVPVRDSTDRMLARLEREKGVESVVVVVHRVAGADCYEFGMQLARKYGVGSKQQNSGLIIVISTDDRCYYILTGRGLEGTLPDAICRRVENRYMVPALKAGDWDAAVWLSVRALSGYVLNDHSLRPESADGNDAFSMGMGLVVALFIVALLVLVSRAGRWGRRCPHCHKGQMVVTHRQRFRDPRTHGLRMRVTRQCSRCGYTELSDEDDDDAGGAGMMAGVPFLFMGGGPGSRGGGFGGGGDFGGGSFGGGGSGGDF